jgi:SAM-dependent methyltransferase
VGGGESPVAASEHVRQRPSDASGPDSATSALRGYWDQDAATYDAWPDHGPRSDVERAAWASELDRLLPHAPARVLDVGAGTGFLSLAAARLGHHVTSLDVSARMLDQLAASAGRAGLIVETVCGPAEEPPPGPFDAVIERLALWTLPDPAAALAAWRSVTTPGGRLVVVESLWTGGSIADALRRKARKLLHRRLPPEHHGAYPSQLVAELPLIRDPFPGRYLAEIEAAGWRKPKFARLRDVEFARLATMGRIEQLCGTNPQYAIAAEAPKPVASPEAPR